MTYTPGECFTLTPEAANIYEMRPGAVYRVKATHDGTFIADGLPVAVHVHEMQRHPGPPTALSRLKKPRRRPRKNHDLRTPAQKFQADIYLSIMTHKLMATDAILVLTDTANAIEAGTNEQAAAEAVRKTIRQPSARELASKLVDEALKAKAVPGI